MGRSPFAVPDAACDGRRHHRAGSGHHRALRVRTAAACGTVRRERSSAKGSRPTGGGLRPLAMIVGCVEPQAKCTVRAFGHARTVRTAGVAHRGSPSGPSQAASSDGAFRCAQRTLRAQRATPLGWGVRRRVHGGEADMHRRMVRPVAGGPCQATSAGFGASRDGGWCISLRSMHPTSVASYLDSSSAINDICSS